MKMPHRKFILIPAMLIVVALHAQSKKHPRTKNNKAATTSSKKAGSKKGSGVKKETGTELAKTEADTSSPKVVTITSAFKPFLMDAAKVNFTAASPVIDSSKMGVAYKIPSQNLFFTYQPVPLKPLALPVDSGISWKNDQYIKLGAGNFQTFLGEAIFSFGDGKNSITNIRGKYLGSKGNLPSQEAAKWGVDILSVFNTKNNQEWTAHPFYEHSRQYLYGYAPASLNYVKDQLLQGYTAIGIEAGMQNKTATDLGIRYHPQISAVRFFDNHEIDENSFLLKAPINKAFGKMYAFNLGLTADMSTANFPLIPNPLVLKNNLYHINPAVQFTTPNFKINAGIRPTWDNDYFSLLPDLTAEAKLSDANLFLEAGWTGMVQKNTWRSLATYNPWIGTLFNGLSNTRVREQYAGIKAASGDHFSYQIRASLLQLDNQPLFLNNTGDGKTFNVLFEPSMKAFKVHSELAYTVQEKLAVAAGITYTQYSSFTVNAKPWGLLPLEATGSLKWKPIKDLQVKADVFLWDGAYFQDKTLQTIKMAAVADLNVGAEFSVLPKLNIWLQMNNVFNNSYQRWNQYTVLGFNVLGGVVYSFR